MHGALFLIGLVDKTNNAMAEFQKIGQRSSIIFGIESRDFGTSCSAAANYKPIDVQKRKYWLMASQRKRGEPGSQAPELPPFDKQTLINNTFVLGNSKTNYDTETKSSYVVKDMKEARCSQNMSAELKVCFSR